MVRSVKYTLIFLHILKTGGTTLNVLLENYFAPENSFATFPNERHPDGHIDKFNALTEAEKLDIDFLTGHMGFGLHEKLPRPSQYVTMLRDPVARVVSRYRHEQRDEPSHLHKHIQEGMTLAQYAKYYAEAAEMDNLQTRMVAGNWNLRGRGPCTQQMLAQAKANLDQHFIVVGVTERFDETYLLLTKQLNWPILPYKRRNVMPVGQISDDLSLETLSAIRFYNQFDVELFEYAEQLLDKQVRQQGLKFQIELWLFQKMNQSPRLTRYFMKYREFAPRTFLREKLSRPRPSS